jgi:hypothetical protein
MPTSYTQRFSEGYIVPSRPGARRLPVGLVASTTYAAGTVLGEVTATPGTMGPYAEGNTDGTQIPKGILREPCVTDASGNITEGGQSGGNEWGTTEKAATMYISGYFFVNELTGLDSNAVGILGFLVSGSVGAAVTGTAQAGTGTSITLAAGASATNSAYVGQQITVVTANGAEVGWITAYNGATKVATVAFTGASAWQTTPTSTSTYSIAPAGVGELCVAGG